MFHLVCNRFSIRWIFHPKAKDFYQFSLYKHMTPSPVTKMKQKLTSFIISAMIALLGSTLAACFVSDTVSSNGLKQGLRVNWTTWLRVVSSLQVFHFSIFRSNIQNRRFNGKRSYTILLGWCSLLPEVLQKWFLELYFPVTQCFMLP